MGNTGNLTAQNISAIVREQVTKTITQESERDKQKRIGPSDLGDPCAYCLANKMLGINAPREFSIYPWLGTAVHLWLEEQERGNPLVKTEQRVGVGEVAGYGRITGTMDRYGYDYDVVGDYKLLGSKKIKRFKNSYVFNPDGTVTIHDEQLWQYYVQINAYAKGAENEGHPVKWASLILIPRDGSGSINDLEVLVFPYNPDVVDEALARAGAIYEYASEHGTDELESDESCYACSAAGRW